MERETEVTGAAFIGHLQDLGVIRKDSPTQRVIIDAWYDQALMVYVQDIGTTRLLKMAPPDVSGMKIVMVEKEEISGE